MSSHFTEMRAEKDLYDHVIAESGANRAFFVNRAARRQGRGGKWSEAKQCGLKSMPRRIEVAPTKAALYSRSCVFVRLTHLVSDSLQTPGSRNYLDRVRPDATTPVLMAQNVYDSPTFFDKYSQLQRSKEGLDGAAEWPTMRGLAGDVNGLDVLDLGCGYGWFCRWAIEAGASTVAGLDVSEKMLDKARSFAASGKSNIAYKRADLQCVDLPAATYDLVYSSLTFHYLPDLRRMFKQIAHALRPGGRVVFSVEHPAMTSPSDATWKTAEDGKVFWPLNDYGKEGLRVSNWLGADEVHKYHHRLETYLTSVLEAGLTLEVVRESWDDIDLSCDPKQGETGHRPYFLLVKATKR